MPAEFSAVHTCPCSLQTDQISRKLSATLPDGEDTADPVAGAAPRPSGNAGEFALRIKRLIARGATPRSDMRKKVRYRCAGPLEASLTNAISVCLVLASSAGAEPSCTSCACAFWCPTNSVLTVPWECAVSAADSRKLASLSLRSMPSEIGSIREI